ncbi:MAG: hypothetical protein GC162_03240 [Planctomycetes bacterium]|nr:hypothetical protein [Planctomycetota bacterium]
MSESATLITAAVAAEVGPLVRRLRLRRDRSLLRGTLTFVGTHDGRRVIVVVTGIGPDRAGKVTRRMIQLVSPAAVLITGTAGAANPNLHTGHVIEPAQIIDAARNVRLHPTLPGQSRGVLRTSDLLIESPDEKARLFADGVDAIDMESAAIAEVCDHFEVPWRCARAIFDEAGELLPGWLMGMTGRDGRVSVRGAMWSIMTRPHQIGRLMRLGKQARRAAEAAAERIAALL